MKLLVAADSYFYKTPDGKYWCKTIYGYKFWKRYLKVFNEIVVVSRTKDVETTKEVSGFIRVDGPGMSIAELPPLRGMKEYILNYGSLQKAAKKAVEDVDCALIRLPSVSAFMILKYFQRKKTPFCLEVVADPIDAYASNKIAQIYYTKKLKQATLEAKGTSYVTKEFLQKRYPSASMVYNDRLNYFESYYSTIDLKEEFFFGPRKYKIKSGLFKLVHTANSINSDVKGHKELLLIVKDLIDRNLNVEVTFIGDGDKRNYFEEQAKRLNIDKNIHFTGFLSSPSEIREVLLNSDMFVFPTKAEGLPRALIEAMATGLPCLSTNVNGIPELLSNEYLFNPLDVKGFSDKIEYLIKNPSLLNKMSEENGKKALEYIDYKLEERRNEFYSKLKKICEV
ncbi:glycosyltransferase [Peribacillus sp. NPDC097225]|uniref:glycosyltransferase n=1 Tax=Peribacillus sp. NPDC097225 TaxID=3364400 RepID=UPI0037F9F52E